MTDDTISRQAAIDALERGKDKKAKGAVGGFYNQIIDNDIEKLRRLPSAQPGWIPTSDRLPKHDGDYLVTTHSGQIARYIFNGGSSEEYWRRCATAWMPLPKPWEGGQDENN